MFCDPATVPITALRQALNWHFNNANEHKPQPEKQNMGPDSIFLLGIGQAITKRLADREYTHAHCNSDSASAHHSSNKLAGDFQGSCEPSEITGFFFSDRRIKGADSQ
ncbi:hypothetical protein NLX71_23240 [Paenibacillus sp. MZ04-78.2]|uniref:hypothetical protein n=1 Tax=Paenibacillus sp. MZ04-78.2 TaxID=2962034 RepID=UPI0020B8F1FF|nr:hypothetical protein [Paenibacillus sp. MZ04-78.2]MCP3776177.1 hypothetical protein [Paenibacillus sp. MZ04-78.2]